MLYLGTILYTSIWFMSHTLIYRINDDVYVIIYPVYAYLDRVCTCSEYSFSVIVSFACLFTENFQSEGSRDNYHHERRLC